MRTKTIVGELRGLVIFVCVMLLMVLVTSCFGQVRLQDLPRGSTVFSINRVASKNTSPGFWNHTATVISSDFLVESQGGIVEHGQGKGVIYTRMSDFLARDYSRIEARLPPSPEIGNRVGDKAEDLVSRPFRKLSSLPRRETPRRERLGQNCTSVTRSSHVAAMGRQFPKWKIPDRIHASNVLGPRVVIR